MTITNQDEFNKAVVEALMTALPLLQYHERGIAAYREKLESLYNYAFGITRQRPRRRRPFSVATTESPVRDDAPAQQPAQESA